MALEVHDYQPSRCAAIIGQRGEEHEAPTCVCGHAWDDHHHGAVLNPDFPSDDHSQGIHDGMLAQECEFYGANEAGGLDAEGNYHCDHYRAREEEE